MVQCEDGEGREEGAQMLSVKVVKAKLKGKELHWHFNLDRYRWGIIAPKVKKQWLRELWGVTLWDRLWGRDVPPCDRCKEENLDALHVILCKPLCDDCYQDLVADVLTSHD